MASGRVFRGLRVLLPEWRVAMVRPSKPLPPNEALFRVDMRCVCFSRPGKDQRTRETEKE